MDKIYEKATPLLLITGSMISVWFLVANLKPPMSALYTFALCLMIGAYLTIKIFGNNFLSRFNKYIYKLSRQKYFVITTLTLITILGVLVRLVFYFKFTYIPTSDPMTFFDSAKKIVAGSNVQGDFYVAFQPYLSAYNNILGNTMKLIPGPWFATIMLNTSLDILSASILYIFLKKVSKPESYLPVVIFGMWMLSPLNIIFSVLSLPVIIVNFFVILVILIAYLLLQQTLKLKYKNALLLSVIFGLVLGVANCFRPIFFVPIVALTAVFIFQHLAISKSADFFKLFVGCMVLSLIIFSGIQKINLAFVSHQTGLHAAENPSGWSMFVGSTWESEGQWRQYHNDELSLICADTLAVKNFDGCHTKLRKIATSHYKSYGLIKSSSLFIRKLYHQAEDQNYFYNAENSIVGYTKSTISKLINVYTVVYCTVIFLLSANFLYDSAKHFRISQVNNPILLCILLIMIGWFFAFMLVESAPRYSTVLYPAFTIFAVLSMDIKKEDKALSRKRIGAKKR